MRERAIITERRNGTLVYLETKSVRNNDSVQYKGRTYAIDRTKPYYVRRRRTYYLLERHNGQIAPDGETWQGNPHLLDEILSRQVARQLVNSMSTGAITWQIFPIILGAAVGLPCGIILGGYI